jgi:putative ABC transport system permease protein
MRRIAQRFPQDNLGREGVRVRPLPDQVIGAYRQRLFVLPGAVGLVLLIACSNVANLLLARGSARGRELAIRAAIGASGTRIARQLLTESAVLALVAGAPGVGLAVFALRLFVKLAPADIPRLAEARVDGGVLLFALAVSICCSLLFGMAPALRLARQDPQPLLRGGAAWRGRRRDRLRSWLVLAEIALALTLLAGAGLLIRSSLHLQRTPAGFDVANLLAGSVTLPEAIYPRPETVERTFTELADRIAHAPGVQAAAAASAAPLGSSGSSNGLLPEGKALAPENLIEAAFHLVTPGYFATLRIPLLQGRLFAAGDVPGSARVMIVSRELARRTWGAADPIGKRIQCCEGSPNDPRWKTVIGVVGDVRSHGPAEEVVPEFYLPIAQAPAETWTWIQRTMSLVARGPDSRMLAGAMRAAVRGVDPSLPLASVTSMAEAVQGSMAEARFHTALLLCLGLLGLGLTAVGVYGVVAYFASLRTHEIGIRIALGARRDQILGLLAWQGALPLGGGLLAGTCGALAATRWLQGSLYGVTAADPLTFAGAILVLGAAGFVAVVLPAMAATRIDPTRAIQRF